MMMSSFDVLTVFWRASWQAAILAALVFAVCSLTGLSDATSQERPPTAPKVAVNIAESERPIELTEEPTQQQENPVSTSESQKPSEALVTTETPVPRAIEAQQP